MVASIGHYVDNKLVAGKSGRTGDITNPATGEVTAKVAFASVEEIDAAVQIAKKAQLAWAATRRCAVNGVMFNLKGLIKRLERSGAAPVARARQDLRRCQEAKSDAASKSSNSPAASPIICVVISPSRSRRTWTPGRSASRSAWWRASRRSTSPIMIPCWMGAMAVATGNAFILQALGEGPQRADAAGSSSMPRRARRPASSRC